MPVVGNWIHSEPPHPVPQPETLSAQATPV